jgi:Concanavalin A-like lectin/glucanases superfamily
MNKLAAPVFATPTWTRLAFFTVAVILLLAPVPLHAALRHRYTFEGPHVGFGGLFQDLVGNAHGALYGNATIADGKLILPGGGMGIFGDHARLSADGPDGININAYKDATFSIWATTAAEPPDWARYFDLGGTSAIRPGAAGNSIFLTANATGPRQIQMTISNVDSKTEHGLDNFQRLPEFTGAAVGKLHHIVVTFDGTNDVGGLYVNGNLVAENTNLSHELEALQADFALLGASLYASDSSFKGSISQFEIYDTALSAQEVLILYQEGLSDAMDAPSLSPIGQPAWQPAPTLHVAALLGVSILTLAALAAFVVFLVDRKRIFRRRN